MADFKIAQKKVKKHEGGFQAMAKDRGNYISPTGKWVGGKYPNFTLKNGEKGKPILVGTNHGISAPVLSQYFGSPVTIADMRSLTYATATKIYKKNYWDIMGLDRVKNQYVADLLYDGAVNQGVGRMKQFVRLAIKHRMSNPSSNIRMPFSTWTTDQLNGMHQRKLFEEIYRRRSEHYKSLGGPYQAAWIRRLAKNTFEEAAAAVVRNPGASLLILSLLVLIGIVTANLI